MTTKNTEIQKTTIEGLDTEIIQKLVLEGNIKSLKPAQKIQYYNQFCKHLGLNPITQPFQVIEFQGKEVLYATKGCTEQLRQTHGVSVISQESKTVSDLWITTVTVQNKHGRQDMGTGAVQIAGLRGKELANAIMKAETKAKRRATLSICGLGMLDETEVETIPHQTKTSTIADIKSEDKNEGEILEEAINRMKKAKTMDILKALWSEYNYMQQIQSFVEAKDKRKLELERKDKPAKDDVEEAEIIEDDATKSEKS